MLFRTHFRNFIRQAVADGLEKDHKVNPVRAWRAARRLASRQIDDLPQTKSLPIDEQDTVLTAGIADWEIWKKIKAFYLAHKETIDMIVKVLIQLLLGMMLMQGEPESAITAALPPAGPPAISWRGVLNDATIPAIAATPPLAGDGDGA